MRSQEYPKVVKQQFGLRVGRARCTPGATDNRFLCQPIPTTLPTIEVLLNKFALRRMQKHGQRSHGNRAPSKLLHVLHHAEAA